MYRIFVETNFTAAHQLHGYPGHCGRLHGHTWKVRIEVESGTVDALGISIDFKELMRIVNIPLGRLDHQHINEIPPFDRQNPTAENLARYIFEEVEKNLPAGVGARKITVWESDKYGVDYRRD